MSVHVRPAHPYVAAEPHAGRERAAPARPGVGTCVTCRGSGRVRVMPKLMFEEGVQYEPFNRLIPEPCPVCDGWGVWPNEREAERREESRRQGERRRAFPRRKS